MFNTQFEIMPYVEKQIQISNDQKRAVVGYLSRDSDPESPRKAVDNFGTMVCFHRCYNLGDEHSYSSPDDFKRSLAIEIDPTVESRIDYWESGLGWSYCRFSKDPWKAVDERIKAIINKALDQIVMLPLYLYDHSGITMRCSPFSCQWDSGQVGWIYILPETIRHEFGIKKITKQIRERAEKMLMAEVEVYDQYLTNDVYGVCHERFINTGTPDDPEWKSHEEDACWGYYGQKCAEEEMMNGMNVYEKWLN
jgi:hypothetical protein